MIAGTATGGRPGPLSGLRRLVAVAMAREFEVFVLPGPEIARAHGLDIAGAGLRLASTPRHAGVLVVAGPLHPGLRDAASIAFAQMPRPRAILALGAGDIAPLPDADITAPLSQDGLISGLAGLRRAIAAGAFRDDIADFSAPALDIRIEYTCPMHPEVVSDAPGSCPKCGMTLMPRETTAGTGPDTEPGTGHSGHASNQNEPAMAAHDVPAPAEVAHGGGHGKHGGHSADAAPEAAQYTCPMHPEVISDAPGSCPKCGMFLVPVEDKDAGSDHSGHGKHGSHGDHGKHASAEAAQYTCPMHPEVISDAPGSCPKCGMTLEPVEDKDGAEEHAGHDNQGGHEGHGGHSSAGAGEGIEPHFMSMVGITKDLPRSSDGLQMDWLEVPFGPFFPGLPGGLDLVLTLDGDSIAGTRARSLLAPGAPLVTSPLAPDDFVARMADMMPLTPVSYRLLAVRALEDAAGIAVSEEMARGRAGALERERIASHLNWLAGFGAQAGFGWLASRAGALQFEVQNANAGQIDALSPALAALFRRLKRTPLLRMRLKGMARLDAAADATGPVARASGGAEDARSTDHMFSALGFTPAVQTAGDALARFWLRCDEIVLSLGLIAAAGAITLPVAADVGGASGEGEAVVETPRGAARLVLQLEAGRVAGAEIEAPSGRHLALIDGLLAGQEIGDALVAIGSLDISPWEIGA